VMQRNGAGIAFGGGVLQAVDAEQNGQCGKTARITGVRRDNTTTVQTRPTNEHRRPRVHPSNGVIRRDIPAAANDANALLTILGKG
jgi:hypothetical protein